MKRILIICLTIIFCGQSWATTSLSRKHTYYRSHHQHINTIKNRPYLGIGGGVLFPSISKNNSVYTGPGWPNDYFVSRRASNEPYFFIDGGYSFARASKWLPYYSVGLKYMYVASMTMKGYVDQYSLPGFINYNYSYDDQQQNLFAIFKADLVNWHKLMPYFMAGAGVSMNILSSYGESAVSGVTPRVNPGFNAHTNFNFAYTVGAGIDLAVSNNVWLNLEYNYSDFGTITTGRGANYVSLAGYNFSKSKLQNKLTANTALLGLTYYFG